MTQSSRVRITGLLFLITSGTLCPGELLGAPKPAGTPVGTIQAEPTPELRSRLPISNAGHRAGIRPGTGRAENASGLAANWRTSAAPRPIPTSADACSSAILRAEQTYRIPAGMLLAIGKVESGRPDSITKLTRPWPWTANAQGQGMFFESANSATDWVRRQQQGGILSIDVGCMQVNLSQHPNAFQSLEEAFDPVRNASYAARFLLTLYQATGNWLTAIGFYHSQTTALAEPYRKRVQAHLSSNIMNPSGAILSVMGQAWQATMDQGARQAAPAGR